MKTSNKLLTGLFILVILGMLVFNYSLTKEIKKSRGTIYQQNINPPIDSLLIDIDSTEMSDTINNI